MTEAQLQSKITKHLKARGYLVLRLRATYPPGYPDLLIIGSEGKSFYIEVKAKGKKQTTRQKQVAKELESRGFAVWVVYDYTNFMLTVAAFIKRATTL